MEGQYVIADHEDHRIGRMMRGWKRQHIGRGRHYFCTFSLIATIIIKKSPLFLYIFTYLKEISSYSLKRTYPKDEEMQWHCVQT
jgi:hypothetical protein